MFKLREYLPVIFNVQDRSNIENCVHFSRLPSSNCSLCELFKILQELLITCAAAAASIYTEASLSEARQMYRLPLLSFQGARLGLFLAYSSLRCQLHVDAQPIKSCVTTMLSQTLWHVWSCFQTCWHWMCDVFNRNCESVRYCRNETVRSALLQNGKRRI